MTALAADGIVPESQSRAHRVETEQLGMVRAVAIRPAETDEAVLLLKLGINPFHHGTLGMIRGLGRAGVPVFAVMEDAASPAGWSRYLRGRYLWTPDLRDTGTVLRDLVGITRSIGGRPVLIPTDDAGAILVAEHADRLAPYFRLPRQPRDLPRRLSSKAGLGDICRGLGIATPAAQYHDTVKDLATVAGELTYPVVVKVANPHEAGEAGTLPSTTIVTGAAQLRDLSSRCAPRRGPAVVVQEYLPPEHCEDWFFHGCVGDGEGGGEAAFRLSFTGRKIRSFPPTAGLTSLGRAWDNPDVRRIAEDFLSAVGYRGIVDLDLRLDRRTNAYHLLDANPRPGAQFAMARRSDGVDAAVALYRELTGHPVPPQVAQSRDHGLCVENYDALSVVWLFLHGQLTPAAWLRSMRAGPVEWAWFARDDLAPGLLMCIRYSLHLLRRRLLRRGVPRGRHVRPVRRDTYRWGRRRSDLRREPRLTPRGCARGDHHRAQRKAQR